MELSLEACAQELRYTLLYPVISAYLFAANLTHMVQTVLRASVL